MNRATSGLLAVVMTVGAATSVSAANIELFDFGLSVDGVTSCRVGPCDTDGLTDLSGIAGVDDSGFDFVTGLGTLSVTLSGIGSHRVILLLDHQIDEPLNTFFNEFGATSGSPAAGQSWEIDEPGFIFGDIVDNFVAGALDGTNGVPLVAPDDVAMALGWDVVLGPGEIAQMMFLAGTAPPGSGFFLAQTDLDEPSNGATIYVSSTLDVRGGSVSTVPEPSTLLLLSVGVGTVFRRRRGRSASS